MPFERTRLVAPAIASVLLACSFIPIAGSAETTPSRLPPELRGHHLSPPMSEREEPASDEEADAKFQELLPRLEAASARMERFALRFTCDETVRTINYNWQKNEASSESARRYAYLLVFDEDRARYDVLRETMDRDGRPTGHAQELGLPLPDAYAWTFLFNARNQRVLNYRYLGREIRDYRLAHVIEFNSSAPFVEGRDTREWSGTVWIEDNTFDFVRIEALPSFQDRRLVGQWRAFTESFNLPWGKLKPRPRGYEAAVEFNFSRDDLLFPTRVDLREFVWVGRGKGVTDRRYVLDYRNYRFFQTSAEPMGERILDSP